MKGFLTLLLASTITASAFSQNDFKEAFLSRWDHMESYTLELAERMPDSLYDYQPTDSAMTFREQVKHLINHLQWIRLDFLRPTRDSSYALLDWHLFTPQAYREHLAFNFQEVAKNIKKLTEEEMDVKQYFRPGKRELSRYELLYLLLDHTRNHTGQLVVYLRLNGLVPPRYQGW